jgi:sugar O-acyltransferase (sialic acid O-acetyltransferase NeuD family)
MFRRNSTIYIFGAGSHAGVVLDILRSTRGQIEITLVAKDVDALGDSLRKIRDVTLLTQEDFEEYSIQKNNPRFHVAVGSNPLRHRLSKLALEKGMTPISVISPSAVISRTASVGHGVFIGPNANIGPGAIVGDYSIVNSLANLEHDSELESFSHLAPGSCVCGNATVGQGSLVGANSVIKEGCGLGKWSTLGALSYLNFQHSGEGSTLIGAPARLVESPIG